MTNYEMITKYSKSVEDMGRFLCEIFNVRAIFEENNIEVCDICPAKDLCSPVENGMVALLKEKSHKIDWGIK